MTQREQNGNCFCDKAAMRQQQSLTISCDTLVAPITSSRPSLTTWRLHKPVIAAVPTTTSIRQPVSDPKPLL
jgi:hypothetical protein